MEERATYLLLVGVHSGSEGDEESEGGEEEGVERRAR
jgi:hypothetical protein